MSVPSRLLPAPSAGQSFLVLLRMQLARLRRSWRQYVVVSSAMPSGIVLLLRAMSGHVSQAVALQVITGNLVLSVAITSIAMLAQQVAWMKASRTFDYFRTLPVPSAAVVLSILVAYLVFALPGMAIVLIVGRLLYGVGMHIGLLLLPAVLLTGVALSGIGAAIGLLSRTDQLAGLTGNLVMMVVLFLGIIPAARVPEAVNAISWIIPSTYGVHLLMALLGPGASAMEWIRDAGALIAWAAVLFILVDRLSYRVD